MSRSITIKAGRVEEALAGLEASETFEDAERHWSDFLVYWYQALELCDAAGGRQARGLYQSWKSRVQRDPALNYLHMARNADSHTLLEVVAKSEAAIALGALGGYEIEIRGTRPGALLPDFALIPTTDDPPPVLAFFPESIRLRPIEGRKPLPVPEAFAYDIGDPPAPIALARLGARFMKALIDEVFGAKAP